MAGHHGATRRPSPAGKSAACEAGDEPASNRNAGTIVPRPPCDLYCADETTTDRVARVATGACGGGCAVDHTDRTACTALSVDDAAVSDFTALAALAHGVRPPGGLSLGHRDSDPAGAAPPVHVDRAADRRRRYDPAGTRRASSPGRYGERYRADPGKRERAAVRRVAADRRRAGLLGAPDHRRRLLPSALDAGADGTRRVSLAIATGRGPRPLDSRQPRHEGREHVHHGLEDHVVRDPPALAALAQGLGASGCWRGRG